MKSRDALPWLRDTLLRMFPHATRPGLRAIGTPDRTSPVLLTGNYTLTVRRMIDVLAPRSVWLLVANSRGINVWCAATGGHLTDHDVIAAIRSSAVSDRVDHRTIVLPQLAATGVERRRIAETTGWDVRWGPARMEDLDAYLERGTRSARKERWMRFPVWERLEMASIWAVPLAFVAGAGVALLRGVSTGLVVATVEVATVAAMFLLVDRIAVVGPRRWMTYGAFAVLATLAACALSAAARLPLDGVAVSLYAGVCTASMLLLSIDLAGTTPWYPGSVNSRGESFRIDLVEQACAGTAECVQVCPREVLEMLGSARKVAIARPDDCVRCAACIVQCPHDALRFRFDGGRVVDAPTVRRTRVNMLGRRSIELDTRPRSQETAP
jgi:NAD-dependent dihydropyrimidine dehydrogenase PreA subunit